MSHFINNQVNSSLGDTPAFALFGRDTFPYIQTESIDQIYNLDSSENIVKIKARETVFIQDKIRLNIINQCNKRTLYLNQRKKDKVLQVNDRVLVRNHQKKHKLNLAWLGPGQIVELKRNSCVVRIGYKTLKVNINHVVKLDKLG